MLYFILVAAFLAFLRWKWSLLSSIRGACLVGLLAFCLYIAQPFYRMHVLGEKPGEAIAKSKTLPVGLQFIPYLNLTNLILGGPMRGTFCGPCVHYSNYQQGLMDLYGVKSDMITGYWHCAVRFTEDGRTYMTDNGFWYKQIKFIGTNGDWSPEGRDTLYVIKGHPNPLTPYLFPIGMVILIGITYLLEINILGNRKAAVPFRSRGSIRIIPAMTEYQYRRSGGKVMVVRDGISIEVGLAEVSALNDAPDIYFHRDIGHFQFV